MIGFVVRELTYLKALQPIIQAAQARGIDHIVYHMDRHMGAKEYNRPTTERMLRSFGGTVRLSAFQTDQELKEQVLRDRIDCFVSIEVGLFKQAFGSFWHDHGIRVCSIAYLTDTLWQPSNMLDGLDRFYYTSKYLMELYHRFSGAHYNPARDRCLGSPLFDGLCNVRNDQATATLTLLPSIYAGEIEAFFGSTERFIGVLKSFGHNQIFKTRQKHCIPEQARQFSPTHSILLDDPNQVYPPVTTRLFGGTHTTVLFYSSGVYEAVCANQYVVNVRMPTDAWGWSKSNMLEYFGGSAYNSGGVVQSVDQDELLSGRVVLGKLDQTARKEWLARHTDNADSNSSELILEDILK